MHSKPRITAKERFTSLGTVVIACVNRYQDIKIRVGLASDAFERNRKLSLTAIDWHADGYERTGQ
jgi:hypothetical protein